MTEEEFTQWVQKTHKEHKWQSHKIAEMYADLKVKEALDRITIELHDLDGSSSIENYAYTELLDLIKEIRP